MLVGRDVFHPDDDVPEGAVVSSPMATPLAMASLTLASLLDGRGDRPHGHAGRVNGRQRQPLSHISQAEEGVTPCFHLATQILNSHYQHRCSHCAILNPQTVLTCA